MSARLVVVTTGLVLLGLGVLFLVVGLNAADQLASVVGALAGVTGLGLAVWSILPGRGSASRPPKVLPVNSVVQTGCFSRQKNIFYR